jgi:hypothetical protein
VDRRLRVLARLFAVCMACFVELPLAALLAWTAWRALEWAGPPAAGS